MVAKNHCLMKLRDRQSKIPAELTDRMMATPGEEMDWHALVQTDLALDLMETSLKELNPEQLQCVTLFYLQKKSYTDISGETGYTMMQVKSHIQNGKRNLKILIEKKIKSEE